MADYDDEFDYMREQRRYRRPSPKRYGSDNRRSSQFLNPGGILDGGGLMRTRSQGAGPNPIIIQNELVQDNYNRPPPAGYMPYPAMYPPSPDMRGRNRLGEDLADDFVGLALENQRLRSRSRGRSDAQWADRRDDYYEAELRRKERLLAGMEERERYKQDLELQRLKEENERKSREQAAKDERKRILDEYDLEQREKEEKKKEDERRWREKIKKEEEDKKAEWEEFVAKYHAEEAKKKEEKKKHEAELDEELLKRLLDAGYSKGYADRIIAEGKNKAQVNINATYTGALVPIAAPFARPTYVKVHKDYLSVDTLRYYNLPWEYDKKDKNYLVILREISKSETDILFEHTKSLRAGKLLLEAPKRESQYAWVRKRDRSSSRVKKLAIVKFDDE